MIGEHGVMTAPAPDELRPTGRPNARLGQTVRDMVLSLAVVIGVIAVIMLIAWRPQPDPVRVIDPTPALLSARAEAGYPVLYPEGLDASWRPTSARWEATEESLPEKAWFVGFVTPQEQFAQVSQSKAESEGYVVEQTSRGRPAGTWGEWQRYENAQSTRSLVRIVDGVTLVVAGTADWTVLQGLAERLSPTALPRQESATPS